MILHSLTNDRRRKGGSSHRGVSDILDLQPLLESGVGKLMGQLGGKPNSLSSPDYRSDWATKQAVFLHRDSVGSALSSYERSGHSTATEPPSGCWPERKPCLGRATSALTLWEHSWAWHFPAVLLVFMWGTGPSSSPKTNAFLLLGMPGSEDSTVANLWFPSTRAESIVFNTAETILMGKSSKKGELGRGSLPRG